MREILFKAKRISNGKWIEGYLLKCKKDYYICEKAYQCMDGYSSVRGQHYGFGDFILVDKKTICQYTGLTDKNGNKIWENDIVEFEDTGEEGYEYKEGFDFQNRAKVEFTEARWSLTDFISTNSSVVDEMYDHAEFMDFWQYCEVIGNIFDNSELLEQ